MSLLALVGLEGVTTQRAEAVPVFNGGWTQPLDSMSGLSAGFLSNNCGHPEYGSYIPGSYHIANDYGRAAGTAVYSIGAGTVVAVQTGWPGSAVFVKHTAADGTQFLSVYGHLNNWVSSGSVSAGQQIGTVYNDGSNSHLHFGIRAATMPANTNNGSMPCSSWADPNGYVDPLPFLTAHPLNGDSSGPTPLGQTAYSDVDDNGCTDLVLTTNEPTGSKASSALSTCNTFVSPQQWWNGTGYGWSGITPLVGEVAVDADGKKRADYVFLTNEGVNGTKAFVAKSNGASFNAPVEWWNGVGMSYSGIKPSLGDVDGNGCVDLILTTNEATGSKAFVLLSTCNSFLAPQMWWDGAGVGWSGMTPLVDDVTGDKRADYVFLTNEGTNGTKAFVAKSNGVSFDAPVERWNGVGMGYSGIKPAMGDVDGNGCSDLVLVTNESTGFKAFTLLATCITFLAPQEWWNGVGVSWSGITPLVGDVAVDNDSLKRADLVYLTNEGASGTKAFMAKSSGSGFHTPLEWWNGTSVMYSDIKAYLK